jgi:hypothetical protein
MSRDDPTDFRQTEVSQESGAIGPKANPDLDTGVHGKPGLVSKIVNPRLEA